MISRGKTLVWTGFVLFSLFLIYQKDSFIEYLHLYVTKQTRKHVSVLSEIPQDVIYSRVVSEEFQNDVFCRGDNDRTEWTQDDHTYRQFKNIETIMRHPINNSQKVTLLPDYRSPCFLSNRNPSVCGQNVLCLPAFYVIGMAKSGTSTLHALMAKHPLIHSGSYKENFWLEKNCGKESAQLKGYLKFFCKSSVLAKESVEALPSGSKCHPLMIGDFTPTTLIRLVHWPKKKIIPADCIKRIDSSSKILVILRNPATRVLSGYKFNRKEETFSASIFHKEVQHTITWWQQCVLHHSPLDCLLVERLTDRVFGTILNEVFGSMYYLYMKEWLNVYPRENFHVIKFEDFIPNTDKYLNKHVFPFLGLNAVVGPFNTTSGKKRGNSPNQITNMLPETRSLLSQFYRPFNKQLSQLLQDDSFLWSDS